MFKLALFVTLIVVACSLPLDHSTTAKPLDHSKPTVSSVKPEHIKATTLKPKDHSDKPKEEIKGAVKGAAKESKPAPAKSAAKAAKDSAVKAKTSSERPLEVSSERPLEFTSEMPLEFSSDRTTEENKIEELTGSPKAKDDKEIRLEWSTEMMMSGDHELDRSSSFEPLVSEEISSIRAFTEEIHFSSDLPLDTSSELPEKKEDKIDEKKKMEEIKEKEEEKKE